ncbi:MAG: rhomboid family intramembrane serine protease [Betaproteobacteria bacterium]|nr:rhomboid family intramembrane serine protease [Betaproteobacteria bacterium]
MTAESGQAPQGAAVPAPWLDPNLLVENPLPGQWAWLLHGKAEPTTLEHLLKHLQAGPGKTQWSGKPDNVPVGIVGAPDYPRVLPAAECMPLQDAVLAYEAEIHRETRRKNGLAFYPLAVACILLVSNGMGHSTLLIFGAFFALSTGTAHAEAWLALNRLQADPQRYLRALGAQVRYAVWLTIPRAQYYCRTCWMVGIWVVLGLIQMYVAERSHLPYRADVAAAALVKSLVPAEPWRLLTAAMLHNGVLHIYMNVMAMFSLGVILERSVHRFLVVPVWLGGALAGSLLSWAWVPGTSLGASGGIVSVFGFLLVMGWRRRALLPPDFLHGLLQSLVAIALLGILAWGIIDNAAHLGGLLFGVAAGIWVFRDPQGTLPLRDSALRTAIGLAADATFLAIAVFTAWKLLG